jgi:beta-lactamase regulating signal transducer with metallopeptidase domain
MIPLLETALSNVVVAAVLALVALAVGRVCRWPALRHSLWLLVLLKLVTPPIVLLPLPWPVAAMPETVAFENMVGPEAAKPRPDADMVPLAPPGEFEVEVETPPEVEPLPPWIVPAQVAQGGSTDDRAPHEAKAEDQGAPDVVHQTTSFHLPPALLSLPSLPAGSIAVLGWLWLGGSLFWFLVAARRLWRFGRLLRHAEPAPAELQAQAGELARRLGLTHWPRVWLVPGVVSPMLWAVGKAPRLLLPRDLLERLDSERRGTLLAHELAHWLRRDHWVRWLELVVLGLYWWCPLAWWARRALSEAEEDCCDAWVVWALPGSARAYATALVDTLDFLSGAPRALPLAARAVGQLSVLRRRLTMIMRGSTPRNLPRLGLAAVCVLGLMLLPLLPTWAQQFTPGADTVQAPKAQPDDSKVQEEIDKLAKQLKALQDKVKDHAAKDNATKSQAELEALYKKLHDVNAKFAKESQEFGKAAQEYGKQMAQLQQQIQNLGGKVPAHTWLQFMPGMTPGQPVGNMIWKFEAPKPGGLQDKFIAKPVVPPLPMVPGAVPAPPLPPGPAKVVQPFSETSPKNLEKRIQDLEKKIDMLLQKMSKSPTGVPGFPGSVNENFAPKPGTFTVPVVPFAPGDIQYEYKIIDKKLKEPNTAVPQRNPDLGPQSAAPPFNNVPAVAPRLPDISPLNTSFRQ